MERQPTCHLVQVIIGCARPKRDSGMGKLGFPMFFMEMKSPEINPVYCKLFSYFYVFKHKGLETSKFLGYNTTVYAQKVLCKPINRTTRGIDYMSGSSKKKLRKEQYEAALTQKQQSQRKEDRKLKNYTLTFVISMILVVVIAIGIVVTPTITGVIHRNTHAITIGNHELSTAQLSYFYMDEINNYYTKTYNNYYSTYGSMWQLFLILNPDEPLNEQIYNEEQTLTWADYFMNEAIKTATTMYALYDEGKANGFELSEDDQASLDSYFESLESSAKTQGYANVNAYLRNTYGQGASFDGFKEYYTSSIYATTYFNDYCDSLEYTDEQIREYEKDKFLNYTSFDYALYTIQVDKYLGEGTKGEDGKVTYSDEERAAALAAAKKDAETLVASGATTELLNEAIKALEINKDNKNAKATEYNNYFYESVGLEDIQKWLADEARKAGDLTIIEGKITETNEDKTETERVSALNVVLFLEKDDNYTKLVSVRHILSQYKNPYIDSDGNYQYNESTKKAAKEEANKWLLEWEKGEKTAESFGELAKKYSADSNASEGGLYEDIYPGQMVEAFNDWCFDSSRKAGDTGIVETEYGCHVVYFEKTQDISYRDYLIKNDLIEQDSEAWRTELEKKLTVERVNLSGMDWDFSYTY